MIDFRFPEDEEYFAQTLCIGDVKHLHEHFSKFFDFREPQVKRGEFNKLKNKLRDILEKKYGNKCALKISPRCRKDSQLVIDHLIPLSTNKLNKLLRNVTSEKGKKVPTESFGSNNIDNLILACDKCNGLKMNKLPDAYDRVLQILLSRVN